MNDVSVLSIESLYDRSRGYHRRIGRSVICWALIEVGYACGQGALHIPYARGHDSSA
jgi:hypothetical protein